jgi:hypothetical protein
MARPKKNEVNLSGYFRTVFGERPEWLDEKSNDAILARYRADHGLAPDAPLPPNIRQGLSNIKSVLRHKGRKQGRRKAKAAGEAVVRRSGPKLEVLEEMIDDCLTLAKHQDREGLHDVIQLLRRARNAVVWKLGEKDGRGD